MAGGTVAVAAPTVVGEAIAVPAAAVEVTGAFLIAGGVGLYGIISNALHKSESTEPSPEPESTTQKQKTPQSLEEKAAKLDQKDRSGKDFTPAGKKVVKDLNAQKNDGKMVCETCGVVVEHGKKHTKGVTPPNNEAHVDHEKRKRDGGRGNPDNGKVKCRGCNLGKG